VHLRAPAITPQLTYIIAQERIADLHRRASLERLKRQPDICRPIAHKQARIVRLPSRLVTAPARRAVPVAREESSTGWRKWNHLIDAAARPISERLVDTSRPGRPRWCSIVAWGNGTKTAAYRRRKKHQEPQSHARGS
jgi:hypothetical protein